MVKNAIDNPLKSIWSDRTFETEKQWRANVARYLDADSSRRFYFYLATHLKSVYCEHCKKELTIDSFNKTYTFDKLGMRNLLLIVAVLPCFTLHK